MSEQTGKMSATMASKIMRDADKRLMACYMIRGAIDAQIDFIKAAKSAAASALTQAPNKKKK